MVHGLCWQKEEGHVEDRQVAIHLELVKDPTESPSGSTLIYVSRRRRQPKGGLTGV